MKLCCENEKKKKLELLLEKVCEREERKKNNFAYLWNRTFTSNPNWSEGRREIASSIALSWFAAISSFVCWKVKSQRCRREYSLNLTTGLDSRSLFATSWVKVAIETTDSFEFNVICPRNNKTLPIDNIGIWKSGEGKLKRKRESRNLAY